MNITVLFFGITRDLVQNNQLKLELNEQATVLDLKTELFAQFPALNDYKNFSVAVNEEYSEANKKLKNDDVVALIPPVSGG